MHPLAYCCPHPTGQMSTRLPVSGGSVWVVLCCRLKISLLLPLPAIPIPDSPSTKPKRTHLVQWMHRVIVVSTRLKSALSDTALFSLKYRPNSRPSVSDSSCRSHSPPWSQIGQSNGWLIKINSMTPSLAFNARGLLVKITMLSVIGVAQDTTGLGKPCTSTRQIRQLPAIDRRVLKQKWGSFFPNSWQTWKIVL